MSTHKPPSLTDEYLCARLARALRDDRVAHCLWKGQLPAVEKMRGTDDIDLLIDRKHVGIAKRTLLRLGFKHAYSRLGRAFPGVADYYGYDATLGSVVHVQLYTQLFCGLRLVEDMRLAPLENCLIEQSTRHSGDLFPTPPKEMGLIVLVIRKAIQNGWINALKPGFLSRFRKDVCEDLSGLSANVDWVQIGQLLSTRLPNVGIPAFMNCYDQMTRLDSRLAWLRSRRRLVRNVACLRRISRVRALAQWILRRVHIIFCVGTKRTLVDGGVVIAVVGGDGAGKSTVVEKLTRTYGQHFWTRAMHMGKPRRMLLSRVVDIVMRLAREIGIVSSHDLRDVNAHSPLVQFRAVLLARDRAKQFRRAMCHASNGGIVIADRWPMHFVREMDGPCIQTSGRSRMSRWLSSWLKGWEASYYLEIRNPDCLLVLRADPEIAVLRKLNEPSAHVRKRSQEVWRYNWEGVDRARVVDAGESIEAVERRAMQFSWDAV